jgi:hypothetical protein
MDSFFTELGRTVLARWKAVNFSLAAFPQIAQDALEERPPSEHVDVSELIREFLLNDEQPFQTQSGFGQPELVVYDDPRFYIQILFWLEGTTDIHQHMFSGAFHVLQGSSIHSHFRFEDAQPISSHIQVGQLRIRSFWKLGRRFRSSRERIASMRFSTWILHRSRWWCGPIPTPVPGLNSRICHRTWRWILSIATH